MCFAEVVGKQCIIHTTAYDAALEQACLGMAIPIMSFSDQKLLQAYTAQTVGQGLLQARSLTP